jgi:hypothetical protein
MSQLRKALKCQITVHTAAAKLAYSGLFKSTFDAFNDALDRLDGVPAKVVVRAVRS